MSDHVHMLTSIPPKVCCFASGWLYQGQERNPPGKGARRKSPELCGPEFWVRGYFVSTVRLDEEVIRNYIRDQEDEDQRLEQMNLWR